MNYEEMPFGAVVVLACLWTIALFWLPLGIGIAWLVVR